MVGVFRLCDRKMVNLVSDRAVEGFVYVSYWMEGAVLVLVLL